MITPADQTIIRDIFRQELRLLLDVIDNSGWKQQRIDLPDLTIVTDFQRSKMNALAARERNRLKAEQRQAAKAGQSAVCIQGAQ